MELLKQLAEASGKKPDEIKKLIEAKQKELSGLVSEDGAAHILANEFGVELMDTLSEQSKFCLHDLMTGMNSVELYARVQSIFTPREFSRNGGKSRVVSIEIMDETGTVRLVLWGDNVNLVDQLKKNDIIHIKDCYVKEGMAGLELHAGNRAAIEINPKKPPKLPEVKIKLSTIKSLESGLNSVDVAARLVNIYPQRKFNRKDGSEGRVSSIIIGDKSGTIRASLWAENSDNIHNFSSGDAILIENAYTKDGLSGTELQLGWRGRVTRTDQDLPELSKFREVPERAKISEVKQGDSKEIRGAITEILSANIYTFCPKCRKKIDGDCPECGKVTPNPTLIVNLMIDDGTGAIRTVLFRDQAEKLLGKPENLPNPAETAQTHLGQEIIISGNIKFSDFSNSIELSARELRFPNPTNESKLLSSSKNNKTKETKNVK